MDRAQLRLTLTRWVVPRLSLGVEWNPNADEVGPLANLVAVREGPRRPTVMLGISSDRIGTPDGTAYFGLVSKDLEALTGVPIAPYAGASYGTFDDTLRPIGGVRARFPAGVSAVAMHDGVNVHLAVDVSLPARQTLTLLWVDLRDPGIAYSIAF